MKHILRAIVILVLLAGCAPAAPLPTATLPAPTATLIPSTATALPPTPTPIPPTATPKPTATPLPPLTGKPYAQPASAISAANAGNMVELAHWGFGRAEGIQWSADGMWFAIQTPLGALVQMREGETIKVNTFYQGSASFSPKAGFLVNLRGVGAAQTIVVYQLNGAAGTSLLYTREGGRPIFSADDSRIALASSENVLVLETASGKLLGTFNQRGVDHLSFSKDSSLLFSGTRDGLAIWKIGETTAVKTMEFNRLVRLVQSEDGSLLLVQNRNKQNETVVDIWSVKEWKLLGTVKTSGTFTLSPDATRLYAFTNFPTPGSIEVYQLPDGKALPGWRADGSIYRMSISPDGKTLAVSVPHAEIGHVHLYDAVTGKERIGLECQHSCDAQIPYFSPDGKVLALQGHIPMAGIDVGVVVLYETTTGKNLNRLTGVNNIKSTIERLNFTQDGSRLAVLAGAADFRIYFWDVATGKNVSKLSWASQTFNLSALSADGKLAATYDDIPTANLMQTANGNRLASIHNAVLTQFTGDGSLAAGTQYRDGFIPDMIRLWKVPGGEPTATFAKTMLPPLVLSPTGEMGAVLNGFSVQLVKIPSGQFITALAATARPNVRLKVMQFSPDGKTIAAGDENGLVWTWNVESRKQLFIMEGHSKEISAVTFSADGQTLYSLGQDGGVRLWKAADGKLARVINSLDLIVKQPGMEESTFGQAGGLALSPDGKLIALGGVLNPQQAPPARAGVTLLIDAESGALARLIRGGGGKVLFAPDGKTLYTSGDGAVRLWAVLP